MRESCTLDGLLITVGIEAGGSIQSCQDLGRQAITSRMKRDIAGVVSLWPVFVSCAWLGNPCPSVILLMAVKERDRSVFVSCLVPGLYVFLGFGWAWDHVNATAKVLYFSLYS